METVLKDLRYTFRAIRRDLAFFVIAVLILGIGIGANTAIFSLVNALLLRPLPFPDSDRLVWIENNGGNRLRTAGAGGAISRGVRAGVKRGRDSLCEAPDGPFRQRVPSPFRTGS